MFARGMQRRFARLLTLLFAAQVIAGGFCLMSAQAHEVHLHGTHQAMGMAAMADTAIHANCAAMVQPASASQHAHHANGCIHCDQQTALNNVHADQFSAAWMLTQPVTWIDAPSLQPLHAGLFAAHTPTGPPRSSSLLFTITQRIRV